MTASSLSQTGLCIRKSLTGLMFLSLDKQRQQYFTMPSVHAQLKPNIAVSPGASQTYTPTTPTDLQKQPIDDRWIASAIGSYQVQNTRQHKKMIQTLHSYLHVRCSNTVGTRRARSLRHACHHHTNRSRVHVGRRLHCCGSSLIQVRCHPVYRNRERKGSKPAKFARLDFLLTSVRCSSTWY